MRALYMGCNLFGQVPASTDVAIKHPTWFDLESIVDVAIGHSVNIFRSEKNAVVMQGHGLLPKKTHVVTELSIPTKNRIVDMGCSDTRIYFLDSAGKLFVLDFLERDVKVTPKENFAPELKDDKVVRFVTGVGITAGYTAKGMVLKADKFLKFTKDNLVDISSGDEHCLLLDKLGYVYSFGRGRRGQLGHSSLKDENEPRLVEALRGIKIAKISCGSWHSCVLSDQGDAYIWGWNSDGQIGIFDESDSEDNEGPSSSEPVPVSILTTPTPVDIPGLGEKEKIIGVGCGSRHTIFYTDKNAIYGCGSNHFNQLGLENQELFHEIKSILKIKDVKLPFRNIACGPAATAVLFK